MIAASRATRAVTKKLYRCISITQQSSSSSQRNERLLRDASSLLQRHEPMVRIGDSTVCPARGVFCTRNVVAGTGMCLYPGVYTPPLPVIQITDDGLAEDVLLADAGLQNNAYVLTLQAVGGQLDAQPVASSTEESDPSACGHLVNHPSSTTTTAGANVDVLSFTWDDPILLSSQLEADLTYYYEIPNEARADGSPWYLDGSTGQIVYFPSSDAGGSRCRLGGAILFSSCDLQEGDELFLDYKLRHPYPNWAKDWYTPCS